MVLWREDIFLEQVHFPHCGSGVDVAGRCSLESSYDPALVQGKMEVQKPCALGPGDAVKRGQRVSVRSAVTTGLVCLSDERKCHCGSTDEKLGRETSPRHHILVFISPHHLPLCTLLLLAAQPRMLFLGVSSQKAELRHFL